MAKKFDTNRLDPKFPEKVRETETAVLPKTEYQTAKFPTSSVTEEETKRFDENDFSSYQEPFTGQNIPAKNQTAKLYAEPEQPVNRKVDKIGLPENILTALPYIPFSIGLIAGLTILFVVPKSESKVRFHAAQGVAAHMAILIVSAILRGIERVTDFADLGLAIFQVITTIMLVIFAVKAWQGKPIHIESVEDLTDWLEDKIKPKS